MPMLSLTRRRRVCLIEVKQKSGICLAVLQFLSGDLQCAGSAILGQPHDGGTVVPKPTIGQLTGR